MSETLGEINHRPGAVLSAGSQTVLPTVRFSTATTVVFTTAANTKPSDTISTEDVQRLKSALADRSSPKGGRLRYVPLTKGKPLADDDPRLRAMEAYITWQRKGKDIEPGKH